jgi:hypothetical protein
MNMFGPGFLVPPTAFVWARLTQEQFQDVGDPGPYMGQSPDQVRWLLSSIGPGADCGSNGNQLFGNAQGNIIIRNVP